jgi:hypothetical protein
MYFALQSFGDVRVQGGGRHEGIVPARTIPRC